MSLDGLRAWIGLVERKLTMRTRVFLVLVAIAIGGAGAGIVPGDRRPEQRGQQGRPAERARRTRRHDPLPAEAPQASELEADLDTLQAEVAALTG